MLNQNLKKAGRKIMSVFLAFLVILGACPVAAYAEALQRELVYVPEIEIQEEILEGNLFYFASTQLQMEENSDKSFAVRIGRGGDVSSAASVLVKMSDFSAHYGEDYKVALLNGAKANTPDGMYSLTDLMEGEYETGTLPSEEELLEAMENNPELKEEASEAIISPLYLHFAL